MDDRNPDYDIQHARDGGEHVILYGAQTFHVDGYDENTNTVYEFHGCFWHGCPKCYPDRIKQRHKMCHLSMRDVYQTTLAKEDAVFAEGYNVVIMWQCEWESLEKEDETLRILVESFELVSRLRPRDAFCGGRTNAIKLYHVVIDGEIICYLDFYPWTKKNCFYPVGHSVIILAPEGTDISSYFGQVKCKILPPYGLYHPTQTAD